jgi:hypothetical protein
MRRSLCHTALVLALAFFGAACDNVDESIPTTPTVPNSVTETLTGNVTVNGAETKTFNVTASGLVTATLKTVAPAGSETGDATIMVGLGLGTWNGSSCQIVIAKDDSLQGTSVIGQVAGIGTLCVRVYDTGKLTGAIDYTIDVVHY